MNSENEERRQISGLERIKFGEKIDAFRKMTPDERLKAALDLSELGQKICSQKD